VWDGITEPARLRAEADKLRELIAQVDEVAMPQLVALLRERAAVSESLANEIELMIERRDGLAEARRASSDRPRKPPNETDQRNSKPAARGGVSGEAGELPWEWCHRHQST
jgi:hypothetical protein